MEERYSARYVSDNYNIPISTVCRICKKLNLSIIKKQYAITLDDITKIKNNYNKLYNIEVVYVNIHCYTFPSRLNYLSIKQLEEYEEQFKDQTKD